MRTYVMITGILFAALVVAHAARLFAEGAGVAANPFFAVITLLSAGLAGWAWYLLRRSAGGEK